MVIRLSDVSRKYHREGGDSNYFFAVEDVNLSLEKGCFALLKGRSGSGKTTLLSMMAGILAPTSGNVLLLGEDLYAMKEGERAGFRNRRIGVIPQGQSALPSLTVLENVILPAQMYAGKEESVMIPARGMDLLERFGIAHLAQINPRELSGGELRRMAIARSLICQPDLILADEPTADLDDENTKVVLSALKELTTTGSTVLLVSHETDGDVYADCRYRMNGGRLAEE